MKRNNMNKAKSTVALVLLALAVIWVGINMLGGQLKQREREMGGVSSGDAFLVSTSTGSQAQFPNYRNVFRTDFRSGYGTTTPGILGIVNITAKGTSSFCLHDATSTATNAENTVGTTTLACFGPNAPEGEYSFNIPVRLGVLLEYKSADSVGWASTTITGNR